MKKVLYIAAVCMTLLSCSEDKMPSRMTFGLPPSKPIEADAISASVTSLSFSAEGGSESLTITSNFAWEAISVPSWITVSKTSGTAGTTTLTITAEKNAETSARTGTITLGKASSATVSISVSQSAAASVLTDKTFTVTGNGKTVEFKMIAVEGGTFMMGSDDSDAYDDEKPVHQVTLSSYYIGETEVTQALWYAVMGQSPISNDIYQWFKLYGIGDNYPAYYIGYDDCLDFITKLNSLTSQQFRMPTEAEWEFAARGGNKSNGYQYSGSNTIGDVAWYYTNSVYLTSSDYEETTTHPVKGKVANELGLYDMSGNVCEWCSDYFGRYSSTAQTNPTGPSTGDFYVSRGGGCIDGEKPCRVSYRDAHLIRSRDIGLRLALSY